MTNKQKTKFAIMDPPEVEIGLKFPHRKDTERCLIDYDGIEEASVPLYLRKAADHLESEYAPSEKNDKGVELPDGTELKGVSQWDILPSGDSERIMVTGHDDPNSADYIRDFASWPVENMESMEKGFGDRESRISQQQNLHFTQNLRHLDQWKSIERLFGKWHDKTVVLVGAGPGLAQNWQHVPTGDDYVVIAVNRAARILDPKQVDYCVAVDKDSATDWFPEELTQSVPLISSLMCNPDVPQQFEEVYTFRSPEVELNPTEEQKKNIEHLPYLANCLLATYSMLHLGYLAGSRRFIFVGQDFSATTDLYYADEKMTKGRWDARRWWPEEDINGCLALTNRKLRRSANVILGQSCFLSADGCDIINATERGILNMNDTPLVASEKVDKNTTNMPLREAVT